MGIVHPPPPYKTEKTHFTLQASELLAWIAHLFLGLRIVFTAFGYGRSGAFSPKRVTLLSMVRSRP
jgi:succinate dehydrogenase/fumarate reductase cytochrome b subunit